MVQLNEQAQRRSSISKSSQEFKFEKPIKKKYKFSALKDKFEREIASQTNAVRKSSLRGAEAKQELEKLKKMALESKQNEENDTNSKPKYYTERPRPKKLIKRIDNPWVAKLKKQGMSQPRHLCKLMRQMPKINGMPIKRLKRKMSAKGDQIVIEEELSPIVEVTKRRLPPAPISKRQLPSLPTSANSTFIITKQISYNMDGNKMTFSYIPPSSIQNNEKKKMDKNESDPISQNMENEDDGNNTNQLCL